MTPHKACHRPSTRCLLLKQVRHWWKSQERSLNRTVKKGKKGKNMIWPWRDPILTKKFTTSTRFSQTISSHNFCLYKSVLRVFSPRLVDIFMSTILNDEPRPWSTSWKSLILLIKTKIKIILEIHFILLCTEFSIFIISQFDWWWDLKALKKIKVHF